MYEPVADTCVTILPKSTNDFIFSDEESIKEVKNTDNRIKANAPEKPPRRIKLQKLNLKKEYNNEIPRHNITDKNTKNHDNLEHKIDLEDVNRLTLENEKHFKKEYKKFVSVSVQATPSPPYRLRLFPKRSRKIKSAPENCDCNKDRIGFCCVTISRVMFSQCGLTVIIIIWALLGAAAFHETEGMFLFNIIYEQFNH